MKTNPKSKINILFGMILMEYNNCVLVDTIVRKIISVQILSKNHNISILQKVLKISEEDIHNKIDIF